MSSAHNSYFDNLPREQINPYFALGKLIFQRLQWDLTAESWRSRKKIKLFKNKYAGKKAVILCNGPSLNQVDFEQLSSASDVFTFGLNKINLLFSRTNFRPNFIVSVNKHVIEQNVDFFNETDIELFLLANARHKIKRRANVQFLHDSGMVKRFARDCSVSIVQGSTVTYVAMQLAFHMGFEKVALVGCDHSFADKGTANKTIKAGKEDHSHFDKNYFANGVLWQLPDLTSSELHYELARDTFAAFGREIVNCTAGGKLEIFKRSSLNEFLNLTQ